jgi:glycosyltransferase involved in cell wall biosynthesis
VSIDKFDIPDQSSMIKSTHYLMVGNIISNKNQMFCAEIALCTIRDITFIGNNSDQNYFEKLQKHASNKIILENEIVTTKIIKKFQFGLFSSFYESGPLVVLEYLLSEIPFLAYKVGGISETIYKYFPEYFIDNLVLENWIERIYFIESNPISKVEYEKRMSLLMKENFNSEVYRDSLFEIYNSLI